MLLALASTTTSCTSKDGFQNPSDRAGPSFPWKASSFDHRAIRLKQHMARQGASYITLEPPPSRAMIHPQLSDDCRLTSFAPAGECGDLPTTTPRPRGVIVIVHFARSGLERTDAPCSCPFERANHFADDYRRSHGEYSKALSTRQLGRLRPAIPKSAFL